MLRWGIVLGGLLAKNGGYIQEASELLEPGDAPTEIVTNLVSAVFENDVERVRQEVQYLIGCELGDMETALGGVLRRVHDDAVAAVAAKAQNHLSHAKSFGSPEAWVEYAEQQVAMVKRRINAVSEQETPTSAPQS